jgi:putative membrane protein
MDAIGYPVRRMDRVLQILVNAGALYVAVLIVPGLDFDMSNDDWWWKFLLVAVAFSLINSYIRPVLRILTFPISIVTLGLFLLVINALMLMLTGAISDQLGLGLTVDDFWAALLGSVVISLAGWILSMVVGASRLPGKVL